MQFIQRELTLTITPPDPLTVQELFGGDAPKKVA